MHARRRGASLQGAAYVTACFSWRMILLKTDFEFCGRGAPGTNLCKRVVDHLNGEKK
jgi:hypothetical protein